MHFSHTFFCIAGYALGSFLNSIYVGVSIKTWELRIFILLQNIANLLPQKQINFQISFLLGEIVLRKKHYQITKSAQHRHFTRFSRGKYLFTGLKD